VGEQRVTRRTMSGSRRPELEPEPALTLRQMLPTMLLVPGILAGLAYGELRPHHLVGETLAVLALDGSSRTALADISQAGGLILRPGGLAGSVIAKASDAGFVGRLAAIGNGLIIYRLDDGANCAGAIAGRSSGS